MKRWTRLIPALSMVLTPLFVTRDVHGQASPRTTVLVQAQADDDQGRDDQPDWHELGDRIRLRLGGEFAGQPDVFFFGEPKMEKASFLGVRTAPVPPSLRPHVDLPKGVGLVVESVEPDSPAAAAGLKQYDILHKLGDQLLINTEQLAALIRLNPPDTEVTLSLIRQGKPMEVKAKLVEREVPVQPFPQLDIMPLPRGMRGRIELPELPGLPKLDDLPRGPGQFQRNSQAQIVVSDNEHVLKMTIRDGKRTLLATDKDGSVLFEGPVNTPEEIEALPEAIREKVKKMQVHVEQGPRTRTPATRPGLPDGTMN